MAAIALERIFQAGGGAVIDHAGVAVDAQGSHTYRRNNVTFRFYDLPRRYPTSSCKFATQDIFAVSLFLRTGNIRDFAFARSISKAVKPYGLPPAKKYPEHVNQNPPCNIGDGTWFATIDEVWDLE